MRKILLLMMPLFLYIGARAQKKCDCKSEFEYVKDFMEKNYAGFTDKRKTMVNPSYPAMLQQFQSYAADVKFSDQCLLVISQYLQSFTDDHVSIGNKFGTTIDSAYISSRPLMTITDETLERLKNAKGIEGIYLSKYDSSYRMAVIKQPAGLYDYAGIMISSKLPYWKRGMVKLLAKQVTDSTYRGLLYMRNQVPKVEYFWTGRNGLIGDWVREGAAAQVFSNEKYRPVASEKLSDKTLYIKISNFDPSNAHNIDSVFKANSALLAVTPNLVLDLRGNGGGSDFTFRPIIPYLYTNPIKSIGADVYATEANIANWKKELSDPDFPESEKTSFLATINMMEKHKGSMTVLSADEVDTGYQKMTYPKKIVVLIDRGCASTTEEFLLIAGQSSKVTLMGQPTGGTLDYSNWREQPFSCMPYTIRYSTTRSRRIDAGKGIDLTGIAPHILLNKDDDWIERALQFLEK